MRKIALSFAVLAQLALVGCAAFSGNLRKDFDDQQYDPNVGTVGGAWPEGEWMDQAQDIQRGGVGRVTRAPAGVLDYQPIEETKSWVGGEDVGAARRDLSRELGEQEVSAQEMMARVPKRVTRNDFIDQSQTEGSLWASNGQTNYYFSKNKIRGSGDLVSVMLEQEVMKDVYAEIKNRMPPEERDAEMQLADERAKKAQAEAQDQNAAGTATSGTTTAAAGATAQQPGAADKKATGPMRSPANFGELDISEFVNLKTGDSMMGEIIERFPNGNFKVRAMKRISYRNQRRLLTLTGVIKGADISEEDQVNSGKMYEYRVQVLRQ